MRRGVVALVSAAAVVTVCLVGLLVYDAGRDDRIAAGTRVAGVDVGGLDEARARAVLARARGAPLARELTLVHGKRRFELSPAALNVRFDAAGLAGEALRRSREGNPLGRGLRDLFGRDPGIRLGPRVTYSVQPSRTS